MKRFLILASFATFLIGCGKIDVTAENGSVVDGGLNRYLSTVVAAPDTALLGQVSTICQNLKSKELLFRNTYLNPTSRFNFQTSQTNCDGKKVRSVVQTRLSYNGNLQYERLSGDYFVSQVETGYMGVISPLCQYISTLTKPLLVGNSLALDYAVQTGAACANSGNYSCLIVSTAFKQDDGRFLVTKTDRFQIEMSSGSLIGMIQMHEHKNSDLCSESNKSITNVATFDGITN